MGSYMTDEERVSEVLNGKTRIWRFTAEEQSCSSDIADRLLWLGILRAEHELAASVFGCVCKGAGEPVVGKTPPYRFLTDRKRRLPILVCVMKTFRDRFSKMNHLEEKYESAKRA